MSTAFKTVLKFAIVFLVMTIINTVVWEHIAGDLYDCTDATLPGYLEPGHWVDAFDGHPVAVVPKIVHGRSMSEADTIKAGWRSRLLGLWSVFFAFHLVVSVGLACVRWFPGALPKSTHRMSGDDSNLKFRHEGKPLIDGLGRSPKKGVEYLVWLVYHNER